MDNHQKRKAYTLDDYLITESGEVYNKHNNKKIKLWQNNRGYYCFAVNGKNHLLHRLVANLYIPNPENKPQVNHKNGDKSNNSASNLEWVTIQENHTHASVTGLLKHGEECKWAKLTKDDVDYIRKHTELNSVEISRLFGISSSNVRVIRRGESWK